MLNSAPKRAEQTPKVSHKKQSIMEYLPGLSEDTKILRIKDSVTVNLRPRDGKTVITVKSTALPISLF